MEKIYYSFPSPPSGYFWGYNTYYVLFGVFLLIAGLVLIIASYYHHEVMMQYWLPMKTAQAGWFSLWRSSYTIFPIPSVKI